MCDSDGSRAVGTLPVKMVKTFKRASPLPAFLKPTVDGIINAKTDAALSAALENFDAPHKFERPEERSLLNWIEVQERLDGVLARRIAANPVQIPLHIPTGPASGHASELLTAALASAGTHPGRNPLSVAVAAAAAASSADIGEKSAAGGMGSAASEVDAVGKKKDLPPPPLELVQHVLKASVRLVRNASHDSKHMYTSGDTLVSLLADPDMSVVIMALEAIHSLLQRQQRGRMSRALVNYLDAIGRLYALSHGWGGREHGLGIVECCATESSGAIGTDVVQLPASGASVRLDFKKDDVLQLEAHSGGILGNVGTGTSNRVAERALAGVFGGDPLASTTAPQSGASAFEPPLFVASQDIGEDGGVVENPRRLPNEGAGEGRDGAGPSNDVDGSGEGGNGPTDSGARETSLSKKPVSWYVADVQSLQDDEKWLVGPYAKEQGIPVQLRYPLLSAVRRARAFVAGRAARLIMVRIRLLAVSCLALFHPLPSALANVFGFDPELVADVVSLARADSSHGLGDIPLSLRIQAVKCASSVCPDRHRFAQLLTSGGVASHHGTLPSLLRAQVAFLGADEEKTSKAGSASDSQEALLDASVTDGSSPSERIAMAEAVVSLVHNIASYTGGPGATGATALVSSGALGTLVPVLKDKNAKHTRAVTYGIRAMECIIESTHASSGGSAFRDHLGLDLLIQRIVDELGIETEVKDAEMTDRLLEEDSSLAKRSSGDNTGKATASTGEDTVTAAKANRSTKAKSKQVLSKEEEEDERVERDALKVRGETRALYDLLGRRQFTALEALKHPSPSSSSASRGMLPHTGWTLLRGLMRLLQLTLGQASANAQIRDIVTGPLPKALRHLVARPFFFGGSLFASAATTAADIAHAEPTATSALVEAKIGKALLRSIRLGLPPSGEAIRSIPSILAALSLSPSARDEIVAVAPMRSYIARLATPFYGRAMHGETPVHIGNSLDELMRHVEAMRSEGSKALIEFLKSAASFVKEPMPPHLISAAGKEYQAVDSSPRGAPSSSGVNEEIGVPIVLEDSCVDSSGVATSSREIARNKLLLLDKMRLTVANNAARLAGFAQGSAEFQNNVVRMNGLQLMLDLRIAAAHAVLLLNKDGTPASSSSRNAPTPHNTITSLANSFRSFCTRHGTAVMRAVFDVTKEDAAEALRLGSCLMGEWIEREDDALKGTGAGTRGCASDESATSVQDELRKDLNAAVCRLRVDIVILTGLARPGPGWTAGSWKASSAVEVITLIAAVERAARVHIASAHTGLALQSTVLYGRESSLCGGIVSALDDSGEAKIKPADARVAANFISNLLDGSSDDAQKIALAVQNRVIPPGVKQLPRKEVKGVAWALVTFAVSAQNFYSQLSKSLTYNSRRYLRDQSTTGENIRAMASAIGRALALHLMAAVPLWDRSVGNCERLQIPAAWDYVRGVLIELRSCIFDDSRPYEDSARLSTDALLLRSFLAAGGGEALLKACRPGSLANSAFANDPAAAFDAEASAIAPNIYSSLVSLSSGASMPKNPLVIGATLQAAREVLDGKKFNGIDGGIGEGVRAMFCESDFGRMDSALSTLAAKCKLASREYAILMTARDAWSTLNALMNQLSACPGLSCASPAMTSPPSVAPVAESGGVGVTESWSLREVRRSSQALSICVAREALSAPSLTADTREVLAARVLTFIQSVSSSSQQLCQPREASPQHTGDRHVQGVRGFTRAGGASAHALWAAGGRGRGRGGLVAPPFRGRGGRGARAAGQARQELAELMDLYPNQFGDSDMQAAAALGNRAVRAAEPTPEPNPAVLSSIVDMGFTERQGRRALRRVHPAGLEQAMEWLLSHPDEDEDGSSGSNEEAAVPGLEQSDSDDDDNGMNDDNDEGDPSTESPDAVSPAEVVDGGHVAMETTDSAGGNIADDGEQIVRGTQSRSVPPTASEIDGGQESAQPVEIMAGTGGDHPETMHDSPAGGVPSDPVMEDGVDEDTGTALPHADESRHPANASSADPRRTQMDESPEDGPAKNHEDESPAVDGAATLSQDVCRLGPDGHVITAGEGGNWCEGGLLQLAIRIERKELSRVLSRTVKDNGTANELLLGECNTFVRTLSDARESAGVLPAESTTKPNSEEQIQAGKASTASTKFMRLDPVEIADYVSTKASLFEVLVPVTLRAVAETASTNPSDDRPDIGVELLIAMEKDGFLTSEARDKYAGLLADCFTSEAGKKAFNGEIAPVYSLLKSASMWAHHGDLAVRQSLSKYGIGRSALAVIRSSCSRWHMVTVTPSVEEATVRPIEKLSIHESGLGTDSRPVMTDSAVLPTTYDKDADVGSKMQDLRCTAASLLLLDAFVRNQRSDNLQLLANSMATKERSNGSEADKRRPSGEELSYPHLDTPGSTSDGEADPARMHVDENEDEVIETVNLGEEEEDMAKARERCDAEITSCMSEALPDFESWIEHLRISVVGPLPTDESYSDDISIASGIRLCLDLLTAWKNVDVGDALPALLQLLSSLTRENASAFLESDGISVVLGMKELSGHTGCSSAELRLIRSHARSILRHAVEDKESLQEAMETELRPLVSQALQLGPLPLRSVLKLAQPLLERDMSACLCAIAHVVRLPKDKSHVRDYVSARESSLRKSEGRIIHDGGKVRSNVQRVIKSLVALLCPVGHTSDEMETSAGEESEVGKASVNTSDGVNVEPQPRQHSPSNFADGEAELVLFALDVLGELVSVFPVCCATLVGSASPSPAVEGSALDYVVQYFLPHSDLVTKWQVKPSCVRAHDIVEACTHLLSVMCRREASAHQHVVGALTSAAAKELIRKPAPRLRAVRVYAKTTSALLSGRHVVPAFLSSGILDSLLQSLGKMDLNAEGASEVISCVLSATEMLGKLSTGGGGGSGGRNRRDELRSQAAMPFVTLGDQVISGYRPLSLERRLRSMFASMRDSGRVMDADESDLLYEEAGEEELALLRGE